MLREMEVPVIYGPNLALGLLKGKFADAKIPYDNFKLVSDRETIQVGEHFL